MGGVRSASVAFLALAAILLWPAKTMAECRKVGPVDSVAITPSALKDLENVGINRAKIFDALREVSIPETRGCWGGATGNFDNQLVSVGTLQWNYGQNSLQSVLQRYKAAFRTNTALQQEVGKLMPKYGRLIFSSGCLRRPITDDCKRSILELQDGSRLTALFRTELDALFESNQMIQIQTDFFVALLESARDDLRRIFPNQRPTLREIKWAVDTKVQQGRFPGDGDIARVRSNWRRLTSGERTAALRQLVRWYEALSNSIDQAGTRLDWRWNVDRWNQLIDTGRVSDEQADLLNISFLKSRTAQVMSGHWQAVAFQRRAKVILGVGSIGGNKMLTD